MPRGKGRDRTAFDRGRGDGVLSKLGALSGWESSEA
jgi:hypothetical protein